ncbi:AAEL000314-PA, partial [Caligus rogercresseyi]
MLKSGASERPSRLLADVLVEADYRGHFSHGLNRLEMYVDDILLGLIHPHGKPRILKESSSTAWVDGENGLGVVV